MRKNDFTLRENRGIPYYSCTAFESLPWLRHGFSTRRGGAPRVGSQIHNEHDDSLNLNAASWDSTERVSENRRRFLAALDMESSTLITLNQIHSDKVHVVTDRSVSEVAIEGDALITQEKNVAMAIKTADCFPLLIADPIHKTVGAVHSGWRGTLSNIVACTIEAMHRHFGSDPAELMIALGPGIRDCCFEVGTEVADLFVEAYPEIAPALPISDRPGKFLVDLVKVLHVQLTRSGVPTKNHYDLGICTCCNTQEFFSYRAEGASSGRMMSIISIRQSDTVPYYRP